MELSSFWENKENAKKIIDESNQLKAWTEPFDSLKLRFEALKSLYPEAIGDAELLLELEKEINELKIALEELELRKMLSGEMDASNCYLSINAGAGGTESCDWVQMLSRMYQRWASKKNWRTEIIDLLDGEVAGIKSITVKISGPFAYGYAKAEKGVHRLVRISPFDSNAKRHTSFASVEVSPEISDDFEIQIRPEEIRIDTFRASGSGGQHVNVTDSAVRVTHLPTNIIVSCQSERSQLQNKETCFKILRSKLYEKELMDREKILREMSGEKKDIAWGSQIRNYVFQPYTLVKDTRTKYETGKIEAVMDGDLDPFVQAYLKQFG